MAKKRAGGELVAATLAAFGVKEIFALQGGHIDPLLIACADYGIRLTDTRHEASAGHAADAYARATVGRKLGVCVVTAGPGFTNALTGMANAYLDGIPVLFIAGAAPLRDEGANTLQGGFDAVGMAAPVTKWAYRMTSVDRLGEFIVRAIETALSGPPGPVFLEIPIDVMFMPTEEPTPAARPMPAAPAPSASTVDALVKLLQNAQRPVILAGGGSVLSDCSAKLTKFAELTGIPVVANIKAMGILPDGHPNFGGPAAVLGMAAANGSKPDAVVLLGAKMGMFIGGTSGALVPKDAKVAQIDIDAKQIERLYTVDLPIVADCAATVDALLTAAQGVSWKKNEEWPKLLRSLRAKGPDVYEKAEKQTSPRHVHPYHAVKAVLSALPSNVAIVADGGETGSWVGEVARSAGPGQLLRCGYLGCLGISPGFAIGLARSDESRPVVAFAGDGGAGFNIQEFDTMVRHNLPILTVILNNSIWGMSKNSQAMLYGENREAIVALNDTDYDAVAKGFGANGARVTDYGQIAGLVEEWLKTKKPMCLNISTDRKLEHPRTRQLVGDTSGADGIPIPYYANIPNPGR
jgi:acetolactate synthase-1/2/3 large subunit